MQFNFAFISILFIVLFSFNYFVNIANHLQLYEKLIDDLFLYFFGIYIKI